MKVSQMLPSIPDFAGERVAALRGFEAGRGGRRGGRCRLREGPLTAAGPCAEGAPYVPFRACAAGLPRERNPRTAFICFA